MSGDGKEIMYDARLNSYVIGIIIVIGSVAAFLETSFILVLIVTHKQMFTSSYHVLICNLMLSDLIIAIMGMVFRGPGLMDENYAETGSILYIMCYAVPFVIWGAIYCSSLAVLCITYNRMVALQDPLHYKSKITKYTAFKHVMITWFAVLVYGVLAPSFFYNESIFGIQLEFTERCMFDFNEGILIGRILIVIFDSAFFALPLLGILYMYFVILRVMYEEASSSKNINKTHFNKIRNSVFKNISLLLVFFTISWMPNYIVQLIKLWYPDKVTNFVIEDLVVIMFYSNVIIDPLVYGLGSKDFRERVLTLVSEHLRETRSNLRRKVSSWSLSAAVAPAKSDTHSVNNHSISGGGSWVTDERHRMDCYPVFENRATNESI